MAATSQKRYTKNFSQKGLTFCPAYGIIFEQSARTAEERKVNIAGWSSLVARRAHNPKVVGSNPAPATTKHLEVIQDAFLLSHFPSLHPAVPGHKKAPDVLRVGSFCCYAVFRVTSAPHPGLHW